MHAIQMTKFVCNLEDIILHCLTYSWVLNISLTHLFVKDQIYIFVFYVFLFYIFAVESDIVRSFDGNIWDTMRFGLILSLSFILHILDYGIHWSEVWFSSRLHWMSSWFSTQTTGSTGSRGTDPGSIYECRIILWNCEFWFINPAIYSHIYLRQQKSTLQMPLIISTFQVNQII